MIKKDAKNRVHWKISIVNQLLIGADNIIRSKQTRAMQTVLKQL